MDAGRAGTLLNVFIGEADKKDHRPLHRVIVEAAHASGLSQAIVLRGAEGFGANSPWIHTAKILRLSENLPLAIQIVDSENKINEFLPLLSELLEGSDCTATVIQSKVEVIQYLPKSSLKTLDEG